MDDTAAWGAPPSILPYKAESALTAKVYRRFLLGLRGTRGMGGWSRLFFLEQCSGQEVSMMGVGGNGQWLACL